jgi:DUF4097 and DUF4098 domain-containing protein YvlB
MERHQRIATWTGTCVGIALALLLNAVLAHGLEKQGAATEAFHQTYPLAATGRLELSNINGDVHITSWDRNEVEVDAVKTADEEDKLKEAEIRIDAHPDSISIETRYRDNGYHEHTSPASVEYTLTVPRNANLDQIKLINGSLDITGVNGGVRASCINGKLLAHDLVSHAKLETINGPLEANFNRMPASAIDLSSVNGPVRLTLPSDARAEIEASTIHGGIDNNFGLHTIKHQFVGHNLRGELGGGGTEIRLRDVNGPIEIFHADDGKTLSPAKDHGNSDDEI